MAEETFLTDDFLRQLMSVGQVDLLVGIPSHNDARTIAKTVEAVEASFRQYFPRDRVVIVNVDGGSRDATPELVLNGAPEPDSISQALTSLRTERRISTRYSDAPSQGLALRSILAATDLLGAKATAVVSPHTSHFDATWIKSLLEPAYREKFDFVSPLYSRPKFDGLLARNLLYPLSRAVFGRGIRELHSADLGFSGRLATQCLNQDVWHEDAVRAAPEMWMAIAAICSGYPNCQTFLGPRAHASTSSGTDIVAAVRQTVGTLFWCMETQQSFWMERNASTSVPAFGSDHELTSDTVHINRERIFQLFQKGVAELSPILKSILSEETLAQIEHGTALDERAFRFGNELWARAVCEFAASYHREVLNRDHLVQALVPLYRGRICSFLSEHQNSSPEEIESDTESLCLEFERQKPYLIERWKVKS